MFLSSDARKAGLRRAARTGVAGRREKARNEFGLLNMVSRSLEKHLKTIDTQRTACLKKISYRQSYRHNIFSLNFCNESCVCNARQFQSRSACSFIVGVSCTCGKPPRSKKLGIEGVLNLQCQYHLICTVSCAAVLTQGSPGRHGFVQGHLRLWRSLGTSDHGREEIAGRPQAQPPCNAAESCQSRPT